MTNMASRIIHLAITNELIKQFDFSDVERLRLGTIMPDAASDRNEYNRSHFKIKIGNENERSYDLTKYRTLFHDKMLADDLYLGYYLHLIQDLLYRHFVYERYNWDPRPAGNMERLYDDYRQINAFLIKKYDMQNNIILPYNFEKEKINAVACFNMQKFIEEFKNDFAKVPFKERFFFTDSMVDEYISWAVELCIKELDALKEGSQYFNEYEWSWGK